uniref:Family with sequence similarity 177, member A1 n=1 Tax=Nothobranchius korthausae TaxID=1143690 RepID=A0A1A8F7Y7_9TELE
MADVSLYLTNVSVSMGGNMDAVERQSPHPAEFESVELEKMEEAPQKEKPPRRIIHFSSGETMEEYSTDEEEGEEPERRDLLAPPRDASLISDGFSCKACDYLGERMASLFGITSAKYQYAIDEYYRIKKEKEEDKEETRLSEEAERSFDTLQSQEQEDKLISAGDGREVGTALPDVTCQVENESQASPNTIVVPVTVTAT